MGVIQSSIDRGITLISGLKKLSTEKANAEKLKQADFQAKNEALKIQAYKKLHPEEVGEIESKLSEDIMNDVVDAQSYNDAYMRMITQRQTAREQMKIEQEKDLLNRVDVKDHFFRARRKIGGKKLYGKK